MKLPDENVGTVFAYGVTSSGKTHTMHVSCLNKSSFHIFISICY